VKLNASTAQRLNASPSAGIALLLMIATEGSTPGIAVDDDVVADRVEHFVTASR
jgi:hypothetical protein